MTALERAIYDALRNTPAASAFEELLTVGDLLSIEALEECAEAIPVFSIENSDYACECIAELGLQQNVYESACERVADVLADFASPEEPSGGYERGEVSARLDSYRSLK